MIKSIHIKPTASRYEKTKNNFSRQIDIADSYDTFYGYYRDEERLKKFAINYDLANGRMDTSLYDVEDDYCEIDGEKVTISRGEIPHVPMISLVIKSLVGEQINRFWKLSVEDLGPLRQSIQTQEFNKQLANFINENVIKPLEQNAYQRAMAQVQQLDTSILQPQEIEEINNQVQQAISSEVAMNTPQDIVEYMKNEYQNPIARQGQEIMDFLDKTFSLKDEEVDGFKHMLPTGEEYYYVNIEPRGLVFKAIPPDSVEYGGPAEQEWVQHMDWVRIEEMTSVIDVVSKYGEVLRPSHYKELDRLYEPKFGSKYYREKDAAIDRQYVHEFTSDPEDFQNKFGNQDWRLKENTPNIASAYAFIQNKFGKDARLSDFAIRVSKIFWKEYRQMYRVFRMVDGKIKKYFFDEHYQPVAEDLEVKSIRAMEVWQCIKIGTNDPIYLEIGPLKGQYPSNLDPYDVQLPVIGKKYNTFRGRTKNLSIVDLMKQFQRDYDTEMAALRRDLASNIGRVFVMMTGVKPKNMSWSNMISIAKEHNLLLIDPAQRSGGMAPEFLREVNMSKMAEIAERINLLNFILSNLYKVAGFNEYRIGQGGQYANRTNIEAQVNSSYNQTEEMFNTHAKIVELAVNRLFNLARIYYKENPEMLKNILSPTSYMELQYGFPFWYSYFNIKIENSGKVARQAEILRQNIQAFIQNGMEPKDVIQLALAESKNDIIDLVNKIDKRQQEAMTSAQQQQQEQMLTAAQIEDQRKAEERQFLMQLEKMKLDFADLRSQRDSEKFMIANDVDKDGTADLLESKRLEIEQREKEHEDKMALARQKQNETSVQARI